MIGRVENEVATITAAAFIGKFSALTFAPDSVLQSRRCDLSMCVDENQSLL
jgi:hypothetical protein